MSTNHTCTFKFKNSWGVDIITATLRHRQSNEESKQTTHTWSNIKAGETTGADLEVKFQTGWSANRDTWWVTFQLGNGDVYSSKEDFRCNLDYDDKGGVGTGEVDQQGTVFKISPPKSSSCETSSIDKTS